jgi:hypothetical protein
LDSFHDGASKRFSMTERLFGFILLDFLVFFDIKHDVGVNLFMERQFSSLREGFFATREIALVRFLASVNVCVIFEVLLKGETF